MSNNQEFGKVVSAAALGLELGLVVNAGHGLNYSNLPRLVQAFPDFYELNIGHSIISRALEVGITEAVTSLKKLLTS